MTPVSYLAPEARAEEATLEEARKTYNDIKWLRAAATQCLVDPVIDVAGNDIESFEGIFRTGKFDGKGNKNGYDAELAIVGFSADPNNGAAKCSTAIKEALRALKMPNSSNSDVAMALLGTTNFTSGVPRSRLKTSVLAQKAIAESERLTSEMKPSHLAVLSHEDYFYPKSLVDTCYSATAENSKKIGSDDFSLPDVGGKKINVYYRDTDKIRDTIYSGSSGWIEDTGGTFAISRIGDYVVQQYGKKGSLKLGKIDVRDDKIFPLGSIPSRGGSFFADCSNVESIVKSANSNGDLAFSGGKLVLNADRVVSPENEATTSATNLAKYQKILPILTADPSKIGKCGLDLIGKYDAAAGFTSMSQDELAQYFARWLSKIDTSEESSNPPPWTAAEGDKMLACLVSTEQYGSALSDAMAIKNDRLQELGNMAPDDDKEEAAKPQNCKGGVGTIDASLGFFICPLVDMVFGVIHFLETNIILPYLAVSPLEDKGAIFDLWTAVRNISYVFLVLAFLFLIFSETTSFGGEAYQIKRLAPRLLVVAIGITLSYYLVGWAIDFFNILGVGIAQMTQWAIGKTGSNSLVTIEGGAIGAGVAGLIGGVGAPALAIFLFKGVGAPTLGVVALMGVFILIAVAVTIIMRQIIIIALVIASPIAITAALLPNTEKIFKMWWSYLSKALVMYPLIIGLFAAGKIGGSLLAAGAIGGAGVGDDAIKSIMSFVAGVVPLVLVPSTFKLAGGAMAGVYGAMRGGVGKAYNGLMGDARDPNSIRGRRNLGMRGNRDRMGRGVATKLANFGDHDSTSDKRKAKGKGSRRGAIAKGLGINSLGTGVEKFGHFSERLAQQEQERQKISEALFGVDSGDGLGYILGEHLGQDAAGQARFGEETWNEWKEQEKNGTLSDANRTNMESIRQQKKGVPAQFKAAAKAFRSAPLDQQKHLITAWAQKQGGSPNGASTAASYIDSLNLSEKDKEELDRTYMKSVAPNGGMFLKHISEDPNIQKGGGWRRAILDNDRGFDGVLAEQTNPYKIDAATGLRTNELDYNSAAYRTLQKIGGGDTGPIGEMDVDFMSSFLKNYTETETTTDPNTGQQTSSDFVNVDRMSAEERRMTAAFFERADINDYYRQKMDTDTRNKLYGGEGFGKGLVDRRVKGSSDHEEIKVKERDAAGDVVAQPKLDDLGRQQSDGSGGVKMEPRMTKILRPFSVLGDMAPANRGKKGGQPDDPEHIPGFTPPP